MPRVYKSPSMILSASLVWFPSASPVMPKQSDSVLVRRALTKAFGQGAITYIVCRSKPSSRAASLLPMLPAKKNSPSTGQYAQAEKTLHENEEEFYFCTDFDHKKIMTALAGIRTATTILTTQAGVANGLACNCFQAIIDYDDNVNFGRDSIWCARTTDPTSPTTKGFGPGSHMKGRCEERPRPTPASADQSDCLLL